MSKINVNSVVVSSRVRLARNLANFKFSRTIDSQDAQAVFNCIANALAGLFKQKVYSICNLSSMDSGIMLEKHLISPKLLQNKDFSAAVALSLDESVSVMINEEDHLRAQCIQKGFCLDKCLSVLSAIDDQLSGKLDFAFDGRLGFLTSCISNVGTGMRASVMLFLPALSLAGKISKITDNVRKLGLSVRGVYGEDSEEDGYLFQISNTVSLGLSEKQIVAMINDATLRICELELLERKQLVETNPVHVKDMIFRAFAVLSGAFCISENEFAQMVAQVKLGVVLGMLKFKDNNVIEKIEFQCRSSGIHKMAGTLLSKEDENIFRANFLRQVLLQNRIA